LFLIPLSGCFSAIDTEADRIFMQAVADQRLMLHQDIQAEKTKLQEARSRGLEIIEAKRRATGTSLEGLKGPDGEPLLDWKTAELVNNSFGDLKSRFEQAVEGLGKLIDVKYEARENAIRTVDAYGRYVQVRRNTASYAMQGFLQEMGSIGAVGGETDVASIIEQMKGLGLPTSVDEVISWLQTKAAEIKIQ